MVPPQSTCFFESFFSSAERLGGKNNTTKLGVVVYWEKLPSPNLLWEGSLLGEASRGFYWKLWYKYVAWRGSNSRPRLCEDLRRKLSSNDFLEALGEV